MLQTKKSRVIELLLHKPSIVKKVPALHQKRNLRTLIRADSHHKEASFHILTLVITLQEGSLPKMGASSRCQGVWHTLFPGSWDSIPLALRP